MRVRLDEDTLKAVALRTNAEYFHAATAQDLRKVYETLQLAHQRGNQGNRGDALMALAGPR